MPRLPDRQAWHPDASKQTRIAIAEEPKLVLCNYVVPVSRRDDHVTSHFRLLSALC